MNTPSIQEDLITLLPAAKLLQNLGHGYLRPRSNIGSPACRQSRLNRVRKKLNAPLRRYFATAAKMEFQQSVFNATDLDTEENRGR